jgi:polar amino acid transport system permease protein
VTPPLAYQWEFDPVLDALPMLLEGLVVTIEVSVVTMALGFVLAPLVALGRIYGPRPLRLLLWAYVETFRITPLLVQLVWFLYVLPVSLGLKLAVFWLGVIPLTLNLTAFLSEVWRGGILGIGKGQREAALATGMTEAMSLRRIVMPAAFRQAIPIIETMWISLFKDSSLVALVGVHDLMFEARELSIESYRPLEVFSIVAVMYFVLTYPQSLIVNRIYERYQVSE